MIKFRKIWKKMLRPLRKKLKRLKSIEQRKKSIFKNLAKSTIT